MRARLGVVLHVALLWSALFFGFAPGAQAQSEQEIEEAPVQESVEEHKSGLEEHLDEVLDKQEPEEPPEPVPLPQPQPGLGERIRNVIRALPIGTEQARLDLRLRSYYWYTKLKSNERQEAWTYGGWLAYRSGWLADRVLLGARLFISQPIHAPSDRDGTKLLRPRQRPLAVLGESYARVRLAESNVLTLYRQTLRTPYVNRQDNRMTPSTFEAYTIQGTTGEDDRFPRVLYTAAYVSHIKERNADRFVPMGSASSLGIDSKRGTWFAGGQYSFSKELDVGVMNYYTHDVLNIFYARANRLWRPTDAIYVRGTVHFTDQRSTGDDLLTGSRFDTRSVAASVQLNYRSATYRLAASTTSGEASIRSPWGSRPGPVSLMISDYDSADEDALLVGLAYDFKRVGLPGLSAFANLAYGRNAVDDTTRLALPDEREVDLTVDYHVVEGRFKGFWIRVRAAFLDQHGTGSESSNQLRVTLNYDYSLR